MWAILSHPQPVHMFASPVIIAAGYMCIPICVLRTYRYLVDVAWMKQWKKYVGYDTFDQSLAGEESAYPGPMHNSNLFNSKLILLVL